MNIKNFSMRWATRSVRPAAAAGLVLATLGAAACGSATVREGNASSYLIIQNLEGRRGQDGTFDHVMSSDVRTGGGWVEDDGQVTMSASMRDVSPTAPSPTDNNAITINRYRVTYRRSDGRNTPGVDVPYAFDGAVTFTVQPGDAVSIPFVLVRVQAKLEAPLKGLTQLGAAAVISTLADVTFYGRDQTGRTVSVTGTIGVNFADWADSDN